jgi:hypothetical protein
MKVLNWHVVIDSDSIILCQHLGWGIWCGRVYGKGVGMLLDWDLTTMEGNGSHLLFQIYIYI